SNGLGPAFVRRLWKELRPFEVAPGAAPTTKSDRATLDHPAYPAPPTQLPYTSAYPIPPIQLPYTTSDDGPTDLPCTSRAATLHPAYPAPRPTLHPDPA
ncbi:hypothetical protein QQX98_013358, partial [Neonectria punicea]